MFPLRDRNPSDSVPFVTVGIIVACTGGFLYERVLGPDLESFFATYALVPAQITYDLRHGALTWARPSPPSSRRCSCTGGGST